MYERWSKSEKAAARWAFEKANQREPAALFNRKQPVARWHADDLREMVDLQIGVVGIDRGGHFNHEIGEMRDIKSHESQRQAIDEPLGTHRKIGKGDRTGIDLITVVVTAGIHRLNRAFNQCPQAGIVVADLGLRDQRRASLACPFPIRNERP